MFEYFASFTCNMGGVKFGCCWVVLDEQITSWEGVVELRSMIETQERIGGVIILNFQLMKSPAH
jgi:hypothetical protein